MTGPFADSPLVDVGIRSMCQWRLVIGQLISGGWRFDEHILHPKVMLYREVARTVKVVSKVRSSDRKSRRSQCVVSRIMRDTGW